MRPKFKFVQASHAAGRSLTHSGIIRPRADTAREAPPAGLDYANPRNAGPSYPERMPVAGHVDVAEPGTGSPGPLTSGRRRRGGGGRGRRSEVSNCGKTNIDRGSYFGGDLLVESV